MNDITKQLIELQNSIDSIQSDGKRASAMRDEILKLVKEMNSRVTKLEKKHIALEATETERMKNTNRLKNYVWSIVTAVSISLILGIGGLLLLVYRVLQ